MEGGFAPLGGASRRLCVDDSDLEGPTAAELSILVETAWAQGVAGAAVSGMPDVFVYHLSVTDESGCRTATFDDVTASPEMHALVARIVDLVDASRGGSPPDAGRQH